MSEMIQCDIFGNVVPQKLCKCGCGNPVYNGNDYINGHWQKEPDQREKLANLKNKFYNDHPEAREEIARKTKEQFSTQEACDAVGDRSRQYYIDHPEAREVAREKANEQWSTQEARDEHGVLMHQIYVDNPEINYRNSARGQGQDYDKGEWTGYVDNHDRYTREYKQWRAAVFDRDNYICQQCNTGGQIQAHHIHNWANYPDQRFDIDNGITLCLECHKTVRGYEDEYIDMFLMLMN